MSEWQNKSNFEITKAVADIYLTDYVLEGGKVIGFLKREGVLNVRTVYNSCENPLDAWPIILSNRISLSPHNNDEWMASKEISLNNYCALIDKNPLRAAMIVYLEMNGVKP